MMLRFHCSFLLLAITAQFALVGTGMIKDGCILCSSGNRREILKGPLFYGIVFVILTLVYWKDSPIGIVALMLMCGGDGLADVAGRKWGITKLMECEQELGREPGDAAGTGLCRVYLRHSWLR
jgi:phytol kinase